MNQIRQCPVTGSSVNNALGRTLEVVIMTKQDGLTWCLTA